MDNEPIVKSFVGDRSGPPGYAAFFEDTTGGDNTPSGGFLYIQESCTNRIVRHLKISEELAELDESDMEVLWSTDGTRCGVSIRGRMRGIIALNDGELVALIREGRPLVADGAVTDPEWLKGFDDYFDWADFIRARRRYWKDLVRRFEKSEVVKRNDDERIETNFVIHFKGADSCVGVFEDDGTTGYLYVYDPGNRNILQHVHVYDTSDSLSPGPDDIILLWDESGCKCGVVIWNQMRAIIDLNKSRPGRAWMEDPDSPGINDKEWLQGFSGYGEQEEDMFE